MATNMSRRVFLKCAGAAALAVTASGIFAGCSPSGGGSKDTVYGVGESTQINGVNVKLLGYRLDPISGMVENYAGKTFITVCIGLENQSEQTVKMGNTTETELADVLKAQGLPAHLEVWGGDVSHDWYWWGKMWSLFAPRILEK